MRHVMSIVLAVVLTPLIYISAGYSAIQVGEANELGRIQFGPAALGLLSAFLAGGLYALLVMARLSPVGPVLSGLLFLGVTLWRLFGLDGFLTTVPGDLFGVDGLLHVPAGFGTALLAVPLLVTVFSPRRWRGSAQPAPVTYEAAPAYTTQPGSTAPAYQTPGYQTPGYQTPEYQGPGYQAQPAYQPPVYTPPPPGTTSYQPAATHSQETDTTRSM